MNTRRQFQSVHRSRHTNIGQHRTEAWVPDEQVDGFIRG
ncbi:hypothetical protein EV184_12679 [Sinorhizobium americanum]|uniref:Uncharacterized protein n=1 Tax=Sinorhizobium americanum TaxID=194963 RepID=A0A4R2B4Y4_9HYPH|nr:hypothetical protein EV184_12679 [Sinorhizobium americanum]